MNKKPSNKTINVLKTTATIGLFATGIYFLFFRGSKAYGKNMLGLGDYENPKSDVSSYPAYIGRKEYPYEYLGKKKVVRGFPLPEYFRNLQFINGKVQAIVLPNGEGVFGGAKSGQLLTLSKGVDSLSYSKKDGSGSSFHNEKYKDLKGKIVLTKNIYIKNYQVK